MRRDKVGLGGIGLVDGGRCRTEYKFVGLGRSITIVGGGIAGLALGIGLRERGIPVTVLEAGTYPRHRVCGEFLSGRGQAVLAEFGLLDEFFRAGGRKACDTAFFLGRREVTRCVLPKPAFSMSRYDLDRLMAERFRELGGELCERTAWKGPLPEGYVEAAGRRKQVSEKGWRWFGVKAHATNVRLTADLEMHILRNGYVGLARLSNGRVNVCRLFRRRTGEVSAMAGDGERIALLRGVPGSALHTKLGPADFDPGSFCAVGALPLESRAAQKDADFSGQIGDAMTMMPPVTGNGMSLALESAWLAKGPLESYCRGRLSWAEAQQAVAAACKDAFAHRLSWARSFHRLLFAFPITGLLARSGSVSGALINWGFARTR